MCGWEGEYRARARLGPLASRLTSEATTRKKIRTGLLHFELALLAQHSTVPPRDWSLARDPLADTSSGLAAARVIVGEIIQRVDVGAHTPRTRGSAGAPPLGEGARSLWAPRGASHSYMRSSDLVHHLRRIRETHALRATDVT